MSNHDQALQHLLQYPLFEAILHRRSRRVSKGIPTMLAGSLTYTSTQKPQPLTPLEEAVLIMATGVTGLTIPDQPFKTEQGKDLVGTPMLALAGRSASSPDNAQATHFFLINDSGTYLLKTPTDSAAPGLASGKLDEQALIDYAARCKVKVLDQRLDFPRRFPYYFGRNRYTSNVPGSTLLVPVVDMTRQYINQFMYLLCQDDGYRPTFIDDWNFYRLAGVKKWVKNGFLNKEFKIPLGMSNTFRIHVESDLLVQNLLLVTQAMGLGGWVHAAFAGPYLLGAPDFSQGGPGLGFRFLKPKKLWRKLLVPITPLPAWQPNPVGLDGKLEGYCPPYYPDMSAAVDALLKVKYGPKGIYRDESKLDQIFKPGLAAKFIEEVPHYSADTIACCKDVCNYIYDTYGRFPAHVDAMYVPGVWVQAHHLDLDYYDQLFRDGYGESQAQHQARWHAAGS